MTFDSIHHVKREGWWKLSFTLLNEFSQVIIPMSSGQGNKRSIGLTTLLISSSSDDLAGGSK